MTTSSFTTIKAPPPEPWLEVVERAVASIRFGSVQITVHDGRVTQVEAVNRTRISTVPTPPSPRGSGRV